MLKNLLKRQLKMQVFIEFEKEKSNQNSKKLELKENSTVKDLLIELNLNPTIVLVTRNNQLTPEIVRLKNKDKLKILEVVSGG